MKSSFVLDLRYAVNGRETERERERETQRRISHRYGAVRREVVVAGAHAQRESGTNLSLGWRDEGNDKRCLNLSFVRIAKRICASRRTYSISATAITRDDSSRRQRRSRGMDLWGREGRKKGRKEKGGGSSACSSSRCVRFSLTGCFLPTPLPFLLSTRSRESNERLLALRIR